MRTLEFIDTFSRWSLANLKQIIGSVVTCQKRCGSSTIGVKTGLSDMHRQEIND